MKVPDIIKYRRDRDMSFLASLHDDIFAVLALFNLSRKHHK